MTVTYSIFDLTNGKYRRTIEAPDWDNIAINYDAGTEIAVEGICTDAEYYNGSAIVTRPTIPEPQVIGGDDHLRGWASPPPGLHAKVYDTYGEPPILLIDTPLSAPDCALYLVQGGVDYLIELTADFPYLPITVNVSL